MKEISGLQIVYRNPEDLIPYEFNSKNHNRENIDFIKGSIDKFGFVDPVLLNGDKGILAGHGSTLAAIELKLKKIPTVDLSHLTKEEQSAFIMTHNRASEVGVSWNMNFVSMELEALSDKGFDISVTGFDLSFDRDVADSMQIENFVDTTKKHESNELDEDDLEESNNDSMQEKKSDKIVYPIYIMAAKPLYQEYKQMRGGLNDAEFLEILLESYSNA